MDFCYVIDPDSDEPIMLLNQHVGFDQYDGMGVDGAQFQRELLQLDGMGKKRIQVWINSPGGMVLDGWSIYNAILKTKTKVDTYCVGIAASIAGVIFQAGRERNMADYGLLMYHNPFNTADDQSFDKIKKSIITMVASKCGYDEDKLSKEMDDELWLDASEAVARNFADKIEMSYELNKKRGAIKPDLSMPENKDVKARWAYANQVLNKIFESNNKSSMKNIANKLGLQPEASEDAIVAALEEVQNKVAELTAVKNELGEVKNQLAEKDAQLDEANAKVQEFEQKAIDAELENKRIVAANMVEGFAKAGKIKNDAEVVQKWINKAIEDFDFVKDSLENLPVNKAMPDFGGDGGEKVIPYNFATVMAAKQMEKNLKK